jgi:hypothetical protein
MNRYRFPIAVGATSLALVAILVGASVLLIQNALASSPLLAAATTAGMPWTEHGGPWAGNQSGWQLPPEVAGLASVPAADRFSHFRGVQVQLTDKDNKPLNLEVIPGTATAVTQTGLTVATNDGGNRTFTLDDKTAIHAGPRRQSNQSDSVKQNDQVVVVTLNNSGTAMAVIVANRDGFGPRGPLGH